MMRVWEAAGVSDERAVNSENNTRDITANEVRRASLRTEWAYLDGPTKLAAGRCQNSQARTPALRNAGLTAGLSSGAGPIPKAGKPKKKRTLPGCARAGRSM